MGKPTIRFKGYTDDWEQRKLGELGTVQTCKRIFKEQTSEQGDIPFFKNGTIGLEPDSYISREVYEEFRRLYPYPEVGDTLISVVGSIGRTAEYAGKDEYFQDSNVVWLKTDGSINKKFLKISYQVIKWLIEGSTVKHLYNNNILRSEIVMPVSQIEQAKIAEFFEALDHLITLHQCKCDQAKILKKYMLQKMFPQNDEKVPKIRFKSFTDDWEQRKLGDIYGSIGNAFVGTATPYYAEQGHFYLESNNVKDGQINHNSEIFINDEFYEKQKDKWLHTGDMVMVQSGHVGHAAVIPEELDNTAAHALIMFRNPKEEIEPYFLNYEYQTDKTKRKIENITTGNTIKHILASDMQEFIVDVPKYEEQKEIAGYFCSLDYLITLHQHKCEELKNIKKFMLQNMFVQEK